MSHLAGNCQGLLVTSFCRAYLTQYVEGATQQLQTHAFATLILHFTRNSQTRFKILPGNLRLPQL